MRKISLSILIIIALTALIAVASAALPAQVTANIHYPGTQNSYWNVVITSGGGDLPASPEIIPGSCADALHGISGAVPHTFTVYSSLGPNPAPISQEGWLEINWILNNKGTLNKYEFQALVWTYDGGEPPIGWWGEASIDWSKVTAKMDEAHAFIQANPGWTPGPGQYYAAVLIDQTDIHRTQQAIFVPVYIPFNSPEFPTIALPIGMLVGFVGMVSVLKTQKE